MTTHYSSVGQPRQSRIFCRTCVAPIRLIFTPDLQVHTVSRSVRSGLHNKSFAEARHFSVHMQHMIVLLLPENAKARETAPTWA